MKIFQHSGGDAAQKRLIFLALVAFCSAKWTRVHTGKYEKNSRTFQGLL